jgi:hypothetical protein
VPHWPIRTLSPAPNFPTRQQRLLTTTTEGGKSCAVGRFRRSILVPASAQLPYAPATFAYHYYRRRQELCRRTVSSFNFGPRQRPTPLRARNVYLPLLYEAAKAVPSDGFSLQFGFSSCLAGQCSIRLTPTRLNHRKVLLGCPIAYLGRRRVVLAGWINRRSRRNY